MTHEQLINIVMERTNSKLIKKRIQRTVVGMRVSVTVSSVTEAKAVQLALKTMGAWALKREGSKVTCVMDETVSL
ncbi:hypothetical protein [Hafnia phage yong3]|nr:hypothetical protein [Hafnia phage yong3]UPT53028.1 hypothetical protein [Hafnia phage yong3]